MGDLDGDLDLDLAVASDDDRVSVLLNDGDGTFPSQASYGAGNSPESVTIADLDGDLDLDLAVANFFSDNVSILLNDCAPRACAADLDGSGDVGFGDLLILLGSWGPCPPACPAELDGSGDVGFGDLLIVLSTWGPCP